MAMLVAYIDDSGTDAKSTNAVAAGFLSDVRRWMRFEQAWRPLLLSHNIHGKGLHMTDLMGTPRRRAFNDWTNDESRSFYEAAITTIDNHTLMGFSVAVRKADYDNAVKGQLRQKLGGHYRFCVAACVWQIARWLTEQPCALAEPIEFVFASGTNGNKEVSDLFNSLRKHPSIKKEFGILDAPRFEKAANSYPLQAADVIAWWSTQHVRCFDPGKRFMPELSSNKVRTRFFPREALDLYVPEITEKYEQKAWDAPPGGFV